MKWNEAMEKLSETTTVTKRELVLGAATCTLLGMVIGMLTAKIATGWSWSLNLLSGNGCGNQDVGNENRATASQNDEKKECKCKRHKCKNKRENEELVEA